MANLRLPNLILFFLIFVLGISAFFRLWQLDLIPPGLYPDVAINGNDALESLRTDSFKVFYPDNFGREGLFMWLLALSLLVFGISIWSIKIVAAIFGILTILGLYLLIKELFKLVNSKQLTVNSEFIALLSSFFLATSFWHTLFSRIGFRAILLPFILVFAFYFLFRGFRTQKIWSFIVSGIFFGLGFYTYISYRFIILLLPLILLCWFFVYQKQNLQKKFILHTSYFILLIFIIALPIALYFFQNPQDFIGRAAPISVFSAENPIKEFGKSLILHLGMFNFHGDPNWRHNFAGSPMLPWSLGILFLIGVIFSIKELIFSIKNKSCLLLTVNCLLLGWFFVMLLPGILTYEGIPHSLRVIGVIPVVYIFVGLGAWWSYEKLKLIIKNRKALIALCIFFLLAIGYSEFDKYFFNWGKHPKVAEAFTKKYADIGYYLNSLPGDVQKYVIVNERGVPLYGISIPAQSPMFIESAKYGRPYSNYLRAEDLDQIKIDQRKTIIVPLYNGRLFDELQKRFPTGEIQEEKEIKFYEIK